MIRNRRLITEQDLQEAMENELAIRVFKDDHMIDSGGIIIRFDDTTVVVQSGVSELAYHSREQCEFFEMKKKH
ncbi:hypothetical protein FE784_21810 [Paenibacillus hemerocallicola]|uniref:Uncharacterized protein n=1 Tax=Paenibacillus hemerocallicola TaxID=1172614 RepID=A0A5C4T5K1_9BACL|nr:hypothetical protein [Paenibacillus hemerocallicola]TNJ64106.1 hypothetical protein FE784_21810 [Paenibacillus hemerocallicola]